MKTHGMRYTRIYTIYSNLKSRCNNPNNNRYHIYGARGIKCLWNTFEEFHKDMGESYKKHLKEYGKKNTTIDRINNNGNYHKANCRWATVKEQAQNRKQSIMYKGKCMKQWCNELGLNYKATNYKYKKCNVSLQTLFGY